MSLALLRILREIVSLVPAAVDLVGFVAELVQARDNGVEVTDEMLEAAHLRARAAVARNLPPKL